MSSKAQIKKIHTLLSKLGIDDADYRDMLKDYGVTTSRALSAKEAASLINRLEKNAVGFGVWKRREPRYARRFDNLGIREGYATPKQLRHIEGLWFDVTRQGTRFDGLKALKEFLRNRFLIDGLERVKESDVTKILNALKRMRCAAVSKDSPGKGVVSIDEIRAKLHSSEVQSE
jgi:hypothetical protein